MMDLELKYLILIILYVNCLRIKVNNLLQIVYILSYGMCVLLILNLQLSKLRTELVFVNQGCGVGGVACFLVESDSVFQI